ncbi:glycosyltransferase family 39 protein [Massilia sp. BJB1822]|uniref:DUF7024 domain-containing protein n=1 Tax=Massilia sp. BJB1822 TaxID=2744470 RepID=UPI001C3C41F3
MISSFMSSPASRLSPINFRSLCLLTLFLAFVYMTMRNMGIYPSIFGDEWTYSSAARLTPLSEAPLPSYLYFLLYGSTNRCGDGFLECARSLNVLFFLASTPFIYLLARRVTTRNTAAFVALLALLRPANSYTAFFMPETMYYCGFWVFSWYCLRVYAQPDWRRAAGAGLLLGLLMLVKLHALFLLPGYCLFLLYSVYMQRQAGSRSWLVRGILLAGLSVLLMLALRWGIGYLLAGPSSLNLMGPLYGGQAQGKAGVLALLPAALDNLRGHLMGLTLMLGVPLAGLALHGLSRQLRGSTAPALNALALYSLLMLGQLLAVTVLFTAAVAGFGAESNARLHMRYYDFILPLLLILVAAHATARQAQASRLARLLAGLPLAALLLYACWRLPQFSPNYIDSPELFGAAVSNTMRYALTGLGLLCLLVWLSDLRRGARLFLYGLAPLFVLAVSFKVNAKLREAQHADVYAKAGSFAHHYLSPGERDHLTLVGPDAAALFKTRFFIDNARTQLIIQPEGQALTAAQLGGPNAWVLAFGDYVLPEGVRSHISERGYQLLRLAPSADQRQLTNFAEPEYEWSVKGKQGLTGVESWGRWSEGRQVTLEFKEDLPANLTLRLEVAAYGPNANHPFTFRLGKEMRQVRVAQERHALELQFAPDAGTRTLTIEVPQPISPKQLGYSEDQRALGIALYRLQVVVRDEKAQAQR